MKKIVLKYGVITGVISAAAMLIGVLVMRNISFDSGAIMGYGSMTLYFLILYPAMKSYCDTVGGGEIKYLRALSIGLLITAIASVFYSVTWMIVYHTIMPDFMDKYAAHAIDNLTKKGASATEISNKAAEMNQFKEMYKNPVTMFLLTFMEPMPVGIIMSLILSLVVRMKKKRPIA